MGSFKDLIPLFLPSVDSSSNGSCVINGEGTELRWRFQLQATELGKAFW